LRHRRERSIAATFGGPNAEWRGPKGVSPGGAGRPTVLIPALAIRRYTSSRERTVTPGASQRLRSAACTRRRDRPARPVFSAVSATHRAAQSASRRQQMSAGNPGEGQEAAGLALVAPVRAPASGEPGHGALDGPAVPAQPLPGVGALAGDTQCEAAGMRPSPRVVTRTGRWSFAHTLAFSHSVNRR
jgi:hypothetical protein